MAVTTKENVVKNGFYRLLGNPKKQAHQVMELYPAYMTVKSSEHGCISKPYDQFELVDDTTGYELDKWHHEIEDRRSSETPTLW
jgi:hypothetical protein